jgi:hypothetical protein
MIKTWMDIALEAHNERMQSVADGTYTKEEQAQYDNAVRRLNAIDEKYQKIYNSPWQYDGGYD